MAQAALTRPMWLNAWGKLPRSSPLLGSTSSASRPTSFDERGGSFEHRARPVGPARHRQRLGQPERAEQEGAFLAVETVVGPVAVDEPSLVGEPFFRGVDGGQHPGVVGGKEPDQRQHQVGGVQVVGAEGLREGVDPVAPAFAQDGLTDLVLRPRPGLDAVRGPETLGQGCRPLERHPTHQLGVDEVAGLAPYLPDAVIPLLPAPGGGVGQLDEKPSGGRGHLERSVPSVRSGRGPCPARPVVEESVGQSMHGAEQLAVDVELALAPGPVADPNGNGLPPARQVGQLPLGQVVLAADAEHDLQVAVLLEGSGGGGGHVVEELVGLIGTGRHPQRLDGERGVSDPRVAVVPVSGAADDLGERGGGRGADRTGGLERQRLEHPSAVVDQIAPRTDIGLVQPRPGLPPRHRVVQSRRDLGLAPHPGLPVVGPFAVLQGEADPLSLMKAQPARGGRPVDRHGHGARQDQDIGATDGGQSPVDRVEEGEHQAVLRSRGVLHLDLDLPHAARHLAQQELWRVPPQIVAPVAFPHRQRVDDDGGPRGRAVGRLQDHGVIHVATGDRLGARRPHRPVARRLAQQPSEDRRAVEARAAQPVDRPVQAHQRRTVPVRQQGVIADRTAAHRRAPWRLSTSRSMSAGVVCRWGAMRIVVLRRATKQLARARWGTIPERRAGGRPTPST